MPLRGKILNTWELEHGRQVGLLRGSAQHQPWPLASIPDRSDLEEPALPQGLHPRRCRFRRPAHRDAAVRAVPEALPAAGDGNGHVYVAKPPLYPHRCGQDRSCYALDDAGTRQPSSLKRLAAEHSRVKPVVTRFKGLGEMNAARSCARARSTRLTRRLVQLTSQMSGRQHRFQMMDMLLAKKRASDRREWLEQQGQPRGRRRHEVARQRLPGAELRGRREAGAGQRSPRRPTSTTRCT